MVVLGLKVIGAPDPLDVAEELYSAWNTGWATADMDNSWTILGTQVTLGAGVDPGLSAEFPVNAAGGTNLSCPPPNCCILVKKTSAVGGRANQGRMYVPAGYMAEGDVDEGGNISGAAFSGWTGNNTAFLSAVQGGTFMNELGILHELVPSAPTTVTSLVVQSKIATQRRRLHR